MLFGMLAWMFAGSTLAAAMLALLQLQALQNRVARLEQDRSPR